LLWSPRSGAADKQRRATVHHLNSHLRPVDEGDVDVDVVVVVELLGGGGLFEEKERRTVQEPCL